MSLLRIFCPLPDPPPRCQWVLIDASDAPLAGDSTLAQLPRLAERIELVIPAAQVLIARARLPDAIGRRSDALLAYAVEEATASEPEANQVSWLGAVDGADVLAVVDRRGLDNWRDALGTAGIHTYTVCCETLMLPLLHAPWSIAWNGHEGFVRTGALEGAATDCGDHASPPLSLRLMIEDARERNAAPTSIALYVTQPDAAPDLQAWQHSLGIPLFSAGGWNWREASPLPGISIVRQRQRAWRFPPGLRSRLRPVAWIAGVALAFHAVALVADWTRLADEQRGLRHQMESHFRAAFPEAVAVADSALQMRRKLAQARHAANRPDDGDFPVLIVKVASALRDLPPGALRNVSYQEGRMTLELAIADPALVQRIQTRLMQAGLRIESSPDVSRTRRSTVILAVRAA